ncbi:MAG: class I SAM-dependent methyltransferase [Bacteroidota bacterium]
MFARIDEDNAKEGVRSFYDLHPSPPAVEDLDEYRRQWQDEDRRIADFHMHWPRRPYREDLRILVAGCDRAQAARHALRHPSAQVIGIDISETSIEHTLALKKKYNLTNLDVHRLPIEQVQELGEIFDLIVCKGVLHHLSDPQTGLCALRSVLDASGALDLTVHAPYGRAGVYMLQEYCRRLHIGHSSVEIRDLARTLVALPRSHPLVPLLGTAPDLKTSAGMADALLYPQGRSYTVPQLFELLAACGLKFGRWVRQACYLPQCSSLHTTPHAARLRRLPLEEQYAVLELFRGDMLHHNLIAYIPGLEEERSLSFNGAGWLAYIPLSLPDILISKSDLPWKAAGLINPANGHPELALSVDELELQLFNAIDSRRSISGIIQLVAEERGTKPDAIYSRAQLFFEQLWWYDLVGGFILSAKCEPAEGTSS